MIEKWKKILSFKHLVKVDKGGMNWGGVGKISEWWNTHSDIMEQRKTHTHTLTDWMESIEREREKERDYEVDAFKRNGKERDWKRVRHMQRQSGGGERSWSKNI